MEPGGGSDFDPDRDPGEDPGAHPDLMDFEREVNRMAEERDLLDYERQQERPGRLGTISSQARSFLDALDDTAPFGTGLKNWFVRKGITFATSRLPGIAAPVGMIANALYDKHVNNYTDEQINDKYGRAMLDTMTGGMFSAAEMLGRGLQKGARAVGISKDVKGNDPSVGRGETGGVRDVDPTSDAGLFDREAPLMAAKYAAERARRGYYNG